MEFRWKDCLNLKNESEIELFFNNSRRQLIIIGKGFDPRTCEGIKTIQQGNTGIEILLLNYYEKRINSSKENVLNSEKNYQELLHIGQGKITEIVIKMWKEDIENKISITHESIRNNIKKEAIEKYDDIIIDISAMPRTVSFNLIKRINTIKTKEQKLYILVCENSEFDDKIEPIIAAEMAEYLQGFNTFSVGMESNSDSITVWLPILGYNELPAFKKIEEFLKPNEICPVLPFPAQNPRRGENTLRYYGEFLFKSLEIEKRNIIYVPEMQPLLTYQKLCNTVQYYENALNYDKNTEIRYIFSSQSSKLMDVGVLLTIMDLHEQGYTAGMALVENEGYRQTDKYNAGNNKLSCICLDDREFEW